jgi:hypothetical protein
LLLQPKQKSGLSEVIVDCADQSKSSNMKNSIQKSLGILLTIALFGGMIYLRTMQNYTKQNYRSSNFFVFWLSGRLLTDGESPYNPDQWSAGHELYGATSLGESIFLYPLPLAVFMIPLGLFTLDEAYLGWQILSQILIAIMVFALLNRWKKAEHNRLFIPVMLFLLFFGPVYLTLQIGSIGAFTLILLFAAMVLLQKNQSFAAGVLLALTMFKPPQGLSILVLVGVWLAARRDWKAILGIILGGVILWGIGMSIDLNWVSKFLHSSQAAFDRRLGFQSNIWSFSYLLCNKDQSCSFTLGGTLVLFLLGSTSYFLWRNHAKLTVWRVFNIIIPIAFVTTVYLWGYDQILYIIPIVWVIGTLVERTKSYLYAFVFLIVLDLFSFYALVQQATTEKDLWSLGTTIIVLGMLLGLSTRRTNSIVEKDIPASV